MHKRFLTLIIFMLIGLSLWSQQDVQFSHNMFNIMGFNPGYAGMRKSICATALFRQQWLGFQDDEDTRLHPQTNSLNVDAPIPFLRGGLSLGLVQDQLGFETNVGVNLGYAYHTTLGFGNLGVGFQIGFLDKGLDFTQLNPINGGDPTLSGDSDESAMFIDFALGAFYKEDEWWGGLSFSRMFQSSREIGDGNAVYELKRHYYLTGGFDFSVPDYTAFTVSPSVIIKTDINSVQIDVNTLVTYNQRVWGGLSYRHQDAVVVFLGLNFDQISVGYSYDITTSLIGRHGRSYGSHELLVQYCFDLELERLPRPHRTTRFL